MNSSVNIFPKARFSAQRNALKVATKLPWLHIRSYSSGDSVTLFTDIFLRDRVSLTVDRILSALIDLEQLRGPVLWDVFINLF